MFVGLPSLLAVRANVGCVEHGCPRNGALREPVYSRVDVLEVLSPCVTHHFPGVGSLHAPYGLPPLLAVDRVTIKARL